MGTDTDTSMSTRPDTRGFNADLRDGRRVRVRLITPADKSGLAAGLARMSPRSRYLRFHRMVERLSDDELRYLTELDMRDHFAWVAVSLDEPGQPGIGVIRYVRDAADRRTAEVAITIVDDWQGVGLGRLLLETLLVSAMMNGIERLRAVVLPEDEAALRLFRGVGGRPAAAEGGVLVVDIPVSSPERTLFASAPHQALEPGVGAAALHRTRKSWEVRP